MIVKILIKQMEEFYNVIKDLTNEEIHIVMSKMDLDTIADHYLDTMEVDESCETLIKLLQYLYNNTDIIRPISDDKYDRLYALYTETHNDIVGAPVAHNSDKDIRYHSYPDLRGTLDKVHYFKSSDKKEKDSRRSVEDWLNTIKRIDPYVERADLLVDIYPKWDGISGVFECDSDGNINLVLTRGDTESNEAVNLTKYFMDTKFEDLVQENHSKFGVKTELLVSKEDFKKVREIDDFSSPRSAVSAMFTPDSVSMELIKYLTVVPLRTQNYETKEINVVDFMNLSDTAYLCDIETLSTKCISLYNKVSELYPIDGVVLVLRSEKMRSILGRKQNINKYEIAFKFPAESKITKLKRVSFSVGNLGGITPVASVEPVTIKGNVITNVSLGSIDRFKSLGLSVGDEVIVQYDIIPYLEPHNITHSDPIPVPDHCPVCGFKLEYVPQLTCINRDCPAVKLGKILNYIVKMKISFLSTGTLIKLMNAGFINSITDLYEIQYKASEITELEGIGIKLLRKIVNSIQARSKDVYMHRLLGSLGIGSIGVVMFEKVCKYHKIETFDQICKHLLDFNGLVDIDGFNEITANRVIKGIKDNLVLISSLLNYVTIKPYETSDLMNAVKVYFTYIRDKEFESYLKSIGIQIVPSFTKKVDILIIPDVSSKRSSKIDKAIKWNKEILTLSEAKDKYNYN